MSKPLTLPDWATDSTIASGSESGTPTKVDPGAGYRAQGFVPGLTFVGPYLNYVLNLIYSWMAYLNLSGTDEITYANTRTRTVRVSGAVKGYDAAVAATAGSINGWGYDLVLTNGQAGLSVEVPLSLPAGAILTGYRIRARCLATGVGTVNTLVQKELVDMSTGPGGASTVTSSSSSFADDDAEHTVTVTGLSETILGTTHYWARVVLPGFTAGVGGARLRVFSVEVTYTETRATGSH